MPVDEAAAGLLHRRPFEVAEPPAEREQLAVGQRLTAHGDDEVIEPSAVNRGELVIGDRPEIDAANLGAERAARSAGR